MELTDSSVPKEQKYAAISVQVGSEAMAFVEFETDGFSTSSQLAAVRRSSSTACVSV